MNKNEKHTKLIYNRFIKATAMLLFLITVISSAVCTYFVYYIYSNDIVGEKGTFQETEVAEGMVRRQASNLMSTIYNYYYDEKVGPYYEDYSEDYTVEQSSKNAEDLLNYIINSEEEKEYILNEMSYHSKNYLFRVTFDGTVVVTNMDDDVEAEKICSDTHIIDGNTYINIESYLRKNLEKGDMFYRKSQIFSMITENYTAIKVGLVISIITAILMFSYILVVAGYNQQGELEISWVDKLPLELLGFIELSITFILFETTFYSDRIIYYIYLIIIGSVWYMISINIFVSILSRFKNQIFIEKWFFARIIRNLVRKCAAAFIDINKKWKAVLAIGSCIFMEMFFVLISGAFYNGTGFFFWLLIKAAQFILLMYAFSMAVNLNEIIKKISSGDNDIEQDVNQLTGISRQSGMYLCDISAGLDKAVSEQVKSEKLRTELITNVSHDIKTPLTSIINYIDLMNKEDVQNEKVKEYMGIAYKQSLRLKKLTEDLIEASKAATGNIEVNNIELNIYEMLTQAVGEYSDRFEKNNIVPMLCEPDERYQVWADGRLLWRVIDNLFSNVCKYAMDGTRMYIDIVEEDDKIDILIKNVSKYQLNIPGEELMERFVRGDLSRNTSGNGLGLSIAKSLMELQKGEFHIKIDGDMYTAIVKLERVRMQDDRSKEIKKDV